MQLSNIGQPVVYTGATHTHNEILCVKHAMGPRSVSSTPFGFAIVQLWHKRVFERTARKHPFSFFFGGAQSSFPLQQYWCGLGMHSASVLEWYIPLVAQGLESVDC